MCYWPARERDPSADSPWLLTCPGCHWIHFCEVVKEMQFLFLTEEGSNFFFK